MEKKSLSDLLREWRADRPDEWKMDEFIRAAKKLEEALESITCKAEQYMENHACNDFTVYIEHSKNILNQS